MRLARKISKLSTTFICFICSIGRVDMVRSTFLGDEPHGIFAPRHPCRPNGIGMSIVKRLQRENNILIVESVDMLDQTPLLDIKPYIPKFDLGDSASEGWTAGKVWCPKSEGLE
ncbi:MAG: TrmO family methyltransferase [Gallionellaceae bacterium]